jgi:serine/threonine protein kinase/WD40 repeat protein
MNAPPHPEVAILNTALELPPERRLAYLNEACAGEPALRRKVEALLDAHDEADDFLDSPAPGVDSRRGETAALPATSITGERIGRYKLLQQIGEGGCGIVYMAEQEAPVRRRVALKVIKLGMDTKQVIARFEAERQALAMMDHPNIARVLDAGATETGRPYFVMELVRGIKITDYCDESKTSTGARLKLFIQVCQAIQHAHQKGIIHRDIKPSNILVTINDGVPVPKVIDFGIAKATQGRLTDHTLFTAFEQFIGTPAYMSPEQAVLTSLDIDTRSDIYSLGVLLYELLTGRTPFDQDELLAGGLEEMRRTIREKEPLKPSTRLNTLSADALTATAQHRHIEAPKLIHVIRGDLDWIVMKCLEKDRSRRYETANGVASDIGRYLSNEPITARPPSKLYEFQKTVRRHRLGFALATVIGLLMLLGVVGLSVSNARIRREQVQKEAALVSARDSEHVAQRQLFAALKSQAEARRYSGKIGQRVESLAALGQAARIHRDEELRDAAIATLAVPDLRLGPTWDAFDTNALQINFDANYERYAVIDKNAVITIRQVADNRELQRFTSGLPVKSSYRNRGFEFSPDGRWLAKAERDDRWSLWQLDSAELFVRTPPTRGLACSFSRDSAQFAVPIDDSIVILDLHTGKEQKRWPFKHLPQQLAFSPDDSQLASLSVTSAVVSIFNVANGKLISEISTGTNSSDWGLAWHPSGKYLAHSLAQHILLWDVPARTLVSKLEGHAQTVTSISFDPSGNWLISDSWDGTPRLWQPSPVLDRIRFFSGENMLSFSPNGRWAGVVYPGGGKAQLLEFIPSQVYETFFASLADRQHSFHHADISPNGRLLALASTDVSIRELPSGRELALFPDLYARNVKFDPSGRKLVVSSVRGLEVWPLESDPVDPHKIHVRTAKRIPLPFTPHEFAAHGDGRTIAVSVMKSDEARILDLEEGRVRDLKFPHHNISAVDLSSDGQWLATAGWQSTQVQLWNAQTGERVWELTGTRARPTFTPDGRELVVSTSQAYTFYDVTTQQVTRRFQRTSSMHQGPIAFSADGRLMAMELSPGLIRLCEVKSGRTIAHLQDPHSSVGVWMGFTPDGTQLVVMATYAGAIHRWDLRQLRVELKALGLDWDWPELPPRAEDAENSKPVPLEAVNTEGK